MGCGWNGDKRDWKARVAETWDAKSARWGREARGYGSGMSSSGNRAFDEYREETLKRLEEEQREFRDFLERLRLAKDRSEFDAFMSDRKARAAESQNKGPETGEPGTAPAV